MKVLFINSLYAPNDVGGAERAVRVLAETLVARREQAVVISMDPKGRYSKSAINGVTVYYVPLANIHWAHDGSGHSAWRRALWHLINAYNPLMGSRVRKILAAERPDVIEANNLQGFSVAIWNVARRMNIPVIQVLHDYYFGCPNASMYKNGRNCSRQCTMCFIYSTPARLLTHIPVGVSSVSRRVLQRIEQCGLFADAPVKSIVPSAVALNSAVPLRHDRPAGSRLIIGYLGRLDSIKGVEVLLRAVAKMSSDEVLLLLGGKGPDEYVTKLKRDFARSNILFLGFAQPESFFAKIDALVVPSLWEEPMPRVIFEGFANGVPSLVSNVGGMPEIVREGETGWIFPANDEQALGALLKKLQQHAWAASRLASNCCEKGVEFSVDTVFQRHYSDWQRAILGQQRSAGIDATGRALS